MFTDLCIEKKICALCRICARRICAPKKFYALHILCFAIFAELCAENLCTGRISAESRRKKFCARDFFCRRGFLCAEGNFSGGEGGRGGPGGVRGGPGGQNGQKRAKKGVFGGVRGGAQNGQFLSPSGTRVVRRALRPIAQGGKSHQNMH